MTDVKRRTILYSLPTSDGNFDVDITGFGFTPVAAIGHYSKEPTLNSTSSDVAISRGYCNATDQVCMGGFSEDAQGTTDTSRRSDDAAFLVGTGNGGVTETITFVSFHADGVKLNITSADAGVRYISVTLIGGTDVLNTEIRSVKLTTATSYPQTLTFEPTIIYIDTVGNTSTNASANNFILGRGIAWNNGADFNAALLEFDQHNQSTTKVGTRVEDANCVAQYFNNAVSWKGSIASYSGTGFTLTTNLSPANDYIQYMAIELHADALVDVEVVDSHTTVEVSQIGTTASTPDSALMYTSGNSAVNSSTQALSTGMYAVDAGNELGFFESSEDNIATSNVNCRAATNLYHMNEAGALMYEADFSAFTTTGIEMDWTTVDATPRKIILDLWGPGTAASLDLTPSTINSDSASLDPVIQYAAILNLAPAVINSDSNSLDPVITYSSVLTLTPSTINSDSVSLDPVIQFAAILNVAPASINSDSSSLDPVMTFSSSLNLAPNAINSDSISLDPAIQFSSVLNLSPSTINSISASLNPLIEYTSALVISPQAVNSDSASLNPVIAYKSVINITPDVVNSLSVSRNPIISTGQVQTIGTITAGFADDLYSVKYQISGITVNFKD